MAVFSVCRRCGYAWLSVGFADDVRQRDTAGDDATRIQPPCVRAMRRWAHPSSLLPLILYTRTHLLVGLGFLAILPDKLIFEPPQFDLKGTFLCLEHLYIHGLPMSMRALSGFGREKEKEECIECGTHATHAFGHVQRSQQCARTRQRDGCSSYDRSETLQASKSAPSIVDDHCNRRARTDTRARL